MPYLGNSPKDISNRSKISTFRYNATAGQASFGGVDSQGNTPVIAPENIVVTVNGVVMEPFTDYTSNTTHITLVTPASANDDVNILSLNVYNLSDIPKLTGNNTFTGDINVTGNTRTGSIIVTGNTRTNVLSFSDGTQVSTVEQFANRNKIINGAMVWNQRAVTTKTTNGYIADRWYYETGSITNTVTWTTTNDVVPDGFSTSLRANVTVANTNPPTFAYTILNYGIEGIDVADLAFGTANAETITLSFYVRSTLAGDYGLCLTTGRSGGVLASPRRQYPTRYTINTANTWERKVITIPGDTTGTWYNTANTTGLEIIFPLAVGAARQAPEANLNSWSANNSWNGAVNTANFIGSTSSTLWITGVQLEKGTVATPYEHLSIGAELARVSRYCEVFSAGWAGVSAGSGYNYTGTVSFRSIKPYSPSVSVISATNSARYPSSSIFIHNGTVAGLTVGYTAQSSGGNDSWSYTGLAFAELFGAI